MTCNGGREMRKIRVVITMLVLSTLYLGCGAVDDGIGTGRTGILFINDWSHPVEFTIDGCDQFTVPARREGISGRYTAGCESAEVVYNVRAYAEWVLREGNPPDIGRQEYFITVKPGDTVFVRRDYSQYSLDVVSQE
ncbi:MAG: hypothetical protein HOC74_38555 [Gemmatimonadetes bacterium]|nr:hypothetical protein [Gemmatimonadota bacterium]